MMHTYKISVFTLFLAMTMGMAQQKVWTLEDCVSYALEHNLTLKDFEYTNQSNKETYAQSIRNMLPSVNAYSRYSVNFGRSTDPFTNDIITTDFFTNTYSLESTMDLFQGFQKINAIKVSKFLFMASKQDMLQQKYLLAYRVMQAFYDIRFFEGLVAISQEQLEVSQTNYDLVNKQVELGLKAGADLYEAESLLLTDELNLTQSQNKLATAKLSLIQEMNFENASEIEIIENFAIPSSDVSANEVFTDTIYNRAQDFLPLIKAEEFRAKAAKKQVAVSRGGLYPSLTLFAGTGTGFFETTQDTLGSTIPFREQFRNNTFQYIGVNLSVPISNGWSARSRVKQSKIERLRAENNLKTQRQTLFQTIQQLVLDYKSLTVELEQSHKKVEAQSLAFTIAQKRYEKGLINALELFTAKNLFASAQNENLQVRLRKEINKSTLELYSGLPVFNIDNNEQ